MRVLLVLHGFPPELTGGTERYVASLAQAMAERGHEVFVLAGALRVAKAIVVERETVGPVRVLRLRRDDLFFDRWDKSRAPKVERAYVGILREVRPDLVHVHHWIRLTRRLVTATLRVGLPAVVTLHDFWTTCPRCFRLRGADLDLCVDPPGAAACLSCAPRWAWQEDAAVAAEADAFRDDLAREVCAATARIAPSRAHARALCAAGGFDPAGIRILPPPPPIRLRPIEPRSWDGARALALGLWGHQSLGKGLPLLLEGLRRLDRPERVHVHVYGEPDREDTTGRRIREEARGLAVTFHGAYEPRDLERASLDLAVLPTLHAESHSFQLDEAHALGLPILAADAGAIPERLAGRGVLFRRGDAGDLARALGDLLADPAKLLALASRPPPRPVTLAAHVEELLAIYREAGQAVRPAPTDLPAGPTDEDIRRWNDREEALRLRLRENGPRELHSLQP